MILSNCIYSQREAQVLSQILNNILTIQPAFDLISWLRLDAFPLSITPRNISLQTGSGFARCFDACTVTLHRKALLALGLGIVLSACGGGGGSTKSQAVPIEKYHIDEFVANYYLEKCIDAGISAKLKSEKDRAEMISDFRKTLSLDELEEFHSSGEFERVNLFGMELDELELFSGARKCIDSHKTRLEKGMAIACELLPKYKYLEADGYEFCLKAADETMNYFRFRRIFEPNMSIAEVKKVLYEKLDEYITNETASGDSEESNAEVVIEDTGKTDGNGKWILKDGIVELVFPETDAD